MQGLSKQRALQNLRARIETIEKRPMLAQPPVAGSMDLLATPAGFLHEVFADEQRDAGAALGFALAQTRKLLNAERFAVLILQLNHDGRDLGVPYGVGLKGFGIDPATIVLGRMEDPLDLLWTMEEAIACHAVAAVIVDIGSPMKALDFTASRRLGLRSAAAGCSAFILRYGRDREASAARFRWKILPVPSAPMAFDARAPSNPRWKVQLEKGRLGSRRDPMEWVLDWTANGFALVEPQDQNRAAIAAEAALPRPLFVPLGDRLSKAG
jgi:protein ImuA